MSVSDELAQLAALRDQGVLTQEEFERQKTVVLQGGTPSVPLPKKAPGAFKIGCLSIVGILVVLFIIGMFAGKPQNSAASGGSAPGLPVNAKAVTANELFDAYQANEAAAQQMYGDQALDVTGTIAGINLDIVDSPFVLLRTSNEFESVQAPLSDESKAQAASLHKGQKLIVRCTGVSEVIGTPILKDCTIR